MEVAESYYPGILIKDHPLNDMTSIGILAHRMRLENFQIHLALIEITKANRRKRNKD